jgi:hypothetical protein
MAMRNKNLKSIMHKNKALIDTVPNSIATQPVKDQFL